MAGDPTGEDGGGSPDGGVADAAPADGGQNDDGGESAPGGAPPAGDPAAGQDDGGASGGDEAPAGDPAPEASPAPDSGPVVTNSVSLSPNNPVVRPRVRNIHQYDEPWRLQSVRRDAQRNITDKITGEDSWEGNGCFPTAMTIVMNWWANYHGPTKGQLTFPHRLAPPPTPSTTAVSGFTPPQLCQMTGRDAYADCSSNPISDEDYTKRGFNNKAHVEYKVAATNVINGIMATTAPAGGATPNMARVRFDLKGSADDKTALIKQYLHFGPVMVMISYPGHWVVIDAYVDTHIYICDPGAVMAPGGRYYTKGGTPVPSSDLPSGVPAGQAYYIIDATAVLTKKKNKKTGEIFPAGKWLDLLRTMDVIYVPDPDDSDDTGDKAYVRKPFYPHKDFDIPAPMNQDVVSSGGGATSPPSSDTATQAPDPSAQGRAAGGSPIGSAPDAGSDAGSDAGTDATDQ